MEIEYFIPPGDEARSHEIARDRTRSPGRSGGTSHGACTDPPASTLLLWTLLPTQAWKEFHEQWIATSRSWLESIGLRPELLSTDMSRTCPGHLCDMSRRLRPELLSTDVHPSNKLAHYARACTDVMFTFPFGTQERLPPAVWSGTDRTPDAHTAHLMLTQHT